MLKAKLVVVGGDAKAAEISLSLPTIIGRGREASLTLPHPLVSRQHCELFEKEGLLHVRDMKSLNGTYVDSQRIEASSILKPDQLLTIGNVTFRAVYSSKDSSVAEPNANTSNVIEFDEVNSSADSDSKIDSDPGPLSTRPTQRGTRKKNPSKPAAAKQDDHQNGGQNDLQNDHQNSGQNDNQQDILQTISAADIRNKAAVNSDVLHDFGEPAETPAAPQHSIVAAMNQAGVSIDPRDDASLSDLRNQLPDGSVPEASGVDGLVADVSQVPAPQADFSSIDLDKQSSDKVESDESALGSFIRKLPR